MADDAYIVSNNPSIEEYNCDPSLKVVNNFFNIDQYQCDERFFEEDDPPLSKAIGYVIVLAFGIAFGIATVAIVMIERKVLRKNLDSEVFNTAGRSIKVRSSSMNSLEEVLIGEGRRGWVVVYANIFLISFVMVV